MSGPDDELVGLGLEKEPDEAAGNRDLKNRGRVGREERLPDKNRDAANVVSRARRCGDDEAVRESGEVREELIDAAVGLLQADDVGGLGDGEEGVELHAVVGRLGAERIRIPCHNRERAALEDQGRLEITPKPRSAPRRRGRT